MTPVNTESWEQLARGLSSEMLAMTDGDTVILFYGKAFVQMQQTPSALIVEAVSNRWLPAERQLSQEDEEKLQAQGWSPPRPEIGSTNWRHVVGWPIHTKEAREAAEKMVCALREIYGAGSPQELERQSFNSNPG